MLRAIVSSLLLIGLLLHPRLIISTGGISFLASKPFVAWLALHHPIKRPIIYLLLYLKIIVHSALGTQKNIFRALKIGADDYLVKPVMLEVIQIRVEGY
jgi:hypothetical protein